MRGLSAEVVDQRLNRRKIDLIPLPGWTDPPKARIADLVAAVERRLHRAGIATLKEVVEIAEAAARDVGLHDARVTSDGKYVEIGLTDKSDSARWAFGHLWERGIGSGLVLIAGDEFGPLGGLPGSDSMMLIPEAARATAVSVGVEPGGLPDTVIRYPGGPASFSRILRDQLRRREIHAVPEIDRSPEWTIPVVGFDVETERAKESLLNLGDGCVSTAGAPLDDHPALSPRVLAAGAYTTDGPDTTLLAGPLWGAPKLEVDMQAMPGNSMDKTPSRASRVAAPLYAMVVRHQQTTLGGKGAALRAGFEAVRGDIVVIQDADLEYSPEEFPQLIELICDGRADVVYGSRFIGRHRVFLFTHYLGNRALTLLTNVLYNTMLTDMETCYKVMRIDVLRSMTLRSNGFGIEPELTAKIFKRGYRVYEIPITYDGRGYDEGKKIGWRDGVVALWVLLRYRFTE
jgi:hypothetical protein